MGGGNLRAAVFAAALLAFPLTNVLVFFGTQLYPQLIGSLDPGEALPPTPQSPPPAAAPPPPVRGADAAVATFGGSSANPDFTVSDKEWPLLKDMVESDPLYKTYEAFYSSGAQSWRIQKYGRVCIITDELLGPSASSGMGTSMASLAEALASNGFDVTVFYSRGLKVDSGDLEFWAQYYSTKGIRFVALPTTPTTYDVPDAVAISHRTYVWLSQQVPFDVVHFPDSGGRAYFSLMIKKQNIAFQYTIFVIHSLKPHIWFKMNALSMLDTMHDLILDHLERQSVQMADAVVSPTDYMLEWKSENAWDLHNKTVAKQPNILPSWVMKHKRIVLEEVMVSELVFFTRLELKKGLVLFCDTMDQLSLNPADMEGVKVTFFGRLPETASERLMLKGGVRAKTDEYIKQRSKKWKFPWQILKDMETQARLDYMSHGARLAVLPSLMENAPATIVECLMAGIPVLASDVGGTREVVAPEDRARILVKPNPKALSKRIREVLKEGLKPAKPIVDPTAEKTWVVWHHMLTMKNRATPSSNLMRYERPLVSIIIVTYNNPTYLWQAIQSIEEQDYPQTSIEIVLVDDGSTNPEAIKYLEDLSIKFEAKGWIYRRQENRGPGAARNHGAKLARGEFIMFMDDDNYAKPHEISTFISVAFHTGADVVTCTNDYFYGNDPPGVGRVPTGRWVPLGAAPTVGMFQNLYGDTNHIIRRKVFEALGGFPEDYGYALEDWELFSKSVLNGYNLQTIPEPLYWYRLRDTSHSRSTAKYGNAARTIRPYLRKIPRNLHYLVLFAQGMKDSHDMVHVELEYEHDSQKELRKMLKALANSLAGLCKEGKLPLHSRNLLQNSQFALSAGAGAVQSWRPFGAGYVHDQQGGRISLGNTDSYALKLVNVDWKESKGATQTVVLDQTEPNAIVVSGWSRAEKVSGAADSGYAIYIDLAFKDGTKLWGYTIPFDTGTHSWQFKAGVIDPEVAIHSLQLYTMFRWHSGTAWFDDLAISHLSEGLCDYTYLTLEGLSKGEKPKADKD